jgi:CubicO group peptidase (beta-lactamase class C family)
VRLQVSQETNPWRQVDLAAHAPTRFEPRPSPARARILAARAAERAARWPLRSWCDIPAAPSGFDASQPPGRVSASGLLLGRDLFLHACETRTGVFPLPAEMRMAAFSVTKSLAAVVLFWLAESYGSAVPEERVLAHLAVPPDAVPQWADVTLRDILDMASGIGTFDAGAPYRPFADETDTRVLAWSKARSAAAKLRIAFGFGALPWGRARIFRYNSALFFVLSAAMDALLKAREGPAANLWDSFTECVLNPLGIVALPMMHTEEPDGTRGIPLLATGAYPTLEQAARIAQLLLNDGRVAGRQLLRAEEVRRALDWSGDAASGLPTQPDLQSHNGTYCSGFWRSPYRTREGNLVTTVSMQGYGGNMVVLLPNGTVCLRFAAGQAYAANDMIRTAEAIRGFGPETPGLRQPPHVAGTRLVGATLLAALSANTVVSRAGDWVCFCSPEGRLYIGRAAQDPLVGRWTIEQGRTLVQYETTTASQPSARFAVFETPTGLLFVHEDSGRFTEVSIEAGLTASFHGVP